MEILLAFVVIAGIAIFVVAVTFSEHEKVTLTLKEESILEKERFEDVTKSDLELLYTRAKQVKDDWEKSYGETQYVLDLKRKLDLINDELNKRFMKGLEQQEQLPIPNSTPSLESQLQALEQEQANLTLRLEETYKEKQQILEALEKLQIKEEISRLPDEAKEQLLEQAYLRETKGSLGNLEGLSPEEASSLLKVLTALRDKK
jgi:hypothetical protein